MHPKRKQRLLAIFAIMLALSAAAFLALYALRQNIDLYYTPSQLSGSQVTGQSLRLGGLVKKGSVVHMPSGLRVMFIVTDLVHDIQVTYEGILPDLFRDDQGVVVQGQLLSTGQFMATQVLAKHDENYMPPIVQDALKSAKKAA